MICWKMLGYAGIWTGLVGSLPCHASFSAFLPWSLGGDSWGTVGLVLLLILRALQGLSAGVVDFWFLNPSVRDRASIHDSHPTATRDT